VNKKLRIVHLEDNADDAYLVERELRKVGISFSLRRVDTKEDFLKELGGPKPGLILGDYTLRSFDGPSALESARKKCPDVPFIFVSGTIGEHSAIESLKKGATDYVLKDHLSRLGPAVGRALAEAREKRRRKEAEEVIRRMAYHDPLTNLPNRVLFKERLILELAHARRSGQKLAVMLLDLDHFKDVNDTLGHGVGDKLLKAVGGRLRGLLRETDTIARLGGDEFLLILPEMSQVKHAARFAERILRVFRESFVLDSHKLYVSTSIGIATYPSDGKDADTLVKNADIAMYEVKKCGRNSYQFHSPTESVERSGELALSKARGKRTKTAFLTESAALRLLQQITGVVPGTLNLGSVFRQITDGLVHSLGYTTALILTLNGEKKRFQVKALSTERRLLPQIDKKLGFSLRGFSFTRNSELNGAIRSVMKGRVVIAKTLAEIAYPLISSKVCSILQRLARTKNHMLLPLKVGRKVVGVVLITSPYEQVLEEELRVLQILARMACQAIRNADLHSEAMRAEETLRQSLKGVRRSFEDAAGALRTVINVRDPYTADHQRRVASLAFAIAKEMGLSEDKIEGIRMAGSIHDVGKIVVPGEILSRPGRISEAEFSVIKNHPQIGYEVLKGLNFPWPVAQIVYQHHERLDGSGYPQGLSGSQIILEACILGLADVVEAITYHRPYRPALGIDWALDEISRNRGTLYHPEVVDACSVLFSKKGFKFN